MQNFQFKKGQAYPLIAYKVVKEDEAAALKLLGWRIVKGKQTLAYVNDGKRYVTGGEQQYLNDAKAQGLTVDWDAIAKISQKVEAPLVQIGAAFGDIKTEAKPTEAKPPEDLTTLVKG